MHIHAAALLETNVLTYLAFVTAYFRHSRDNLGSLSVLTWGHLPRPLLQLGHRGQPLPRLRQQVLQHLRLHTLLASLLVTVLMMGTHLLTYFAFHRALLTAWFAVFGYFDSPHYFFIDFQLLRLLQRGLHPLRRFRGHALHCYMVLLLQHCSLAALL